jgi:hypothetical protein
MYEFGKGNVGRSFGNKLLRKISNFGMDDQEMVVKNSQAIGAFQDTTNLLYEPGTNMYDLFTKKIISKILEKKSIAYLDRRYLDKRKILHQYAIKEEIKDYVTRIAEEAINYDDDNYFCSLSDIPDTYDQSIRAKYQENFKKIYNAFNFNDGLTAWNYMKTFLIDGFLAFEIVYDDNQKNIIDLNLLDPLTLIVAAEPGTGTVVWIQNPDIPQLRRVLLDANIIYISYSNNLDYDETSYVEGLIKPYNQLKLLEFTKLMYNLNQASIYKKFVIPVNGLTRQQAEQQIAQLMSEYHEDIEWDDRTGVPYINGSTKIPHSKDYWFPTSELGTPEMEIIQPQQAELNEDVVLQWFYKSFKRASKMPFSRLDEDQGGGNFYDDTASITMDEIRFKTFVGRLRTLFKEILVKPLKIQMILDFPELEQDRIFDSYIKIKFNSNDLFEEWKYLNNLAKRAEIASTLSSNLQDGEGKPYLSIEWIVRNIMKFTDADIESNNKFKMMSGLASPGEGGGGGFGGGGGGFGEEPGVGGGGEFGGAPGGEFGGAQGGPQGEMGGGQNLQGGQAQAGSEFGAAPQGGGAQGGGAQGGAQF